MESSATIRTRIHCFIFVLFHLDVPDPVYIYQQNSNLFSAHFEIKMSKIAQMEIELLTHKLLDT